MKINQGCFKCLIVIFLISIFLPTIVIAQPTGKHAYDQLSSLSYEKQIDFFKENFSSAFFGDQYMFLVSIILPGFFEETADELVEMLNDPNFESVVYLMLKGSIKEFKTKESPLGAKEEKLFSKAIKSYENKLQAQSPKEIIELFKEQYQFRPVDQQAARLGIIFDIKKDIKAFRPLVEDLKSIPEFKESAEMVLKEMSNQVIDKKD